MRTQRPRRDAQGVRGSPVRHGWHSVHDAAVCIPLREREQKIFARGRGHGRLVSRAAS